METQSILIALQIVVIVLILLFIICRQFILWYFKINERIQEQRKTNELLAQVLIALNANNELTAYSNVENDGRELYGEIPEL